VTSEQPVFFYDLGSPECYLVGERVMGELDPVPEWEPVHAVALGIELGAGDREALTAAAVELGLLPMRWPSVWPADTERAMLTATWAKRGGRAVAYSQAAFRQAFAGGRDLGDEGTVLIAAAACEMHPTAVLKGVTLRATTSALAAANQRAREMGITALPALAVGRELFTGPDCLVQAQTAVARAS